MNLHSIVSGAIGSVNPFITATVYKSTGFTAVNFEQVPIYADAVDVKIQKQALTTKDLSQIDGLNIQGITTAAYVKGSWYGVDRAVGQGGDKFVIGDQTWLVVAVLELWPDWCKVALNLQVNT